MSNLPKNSKRNGNATRAIDVGLLNRLEDAIAVLDSEGRILHLNIAATELLGVEERAVYGRAIDELIAHQAGAAPSPTANSQWLRWKSKPISKSLQILNLVNGKELALSISIEHDSTKTDAPYYLILRPISGGPEPRLSRRDSIDNLTGLHNRRAFEYFINQLLSEGVENRRQAQVALYLDVDQFKAINTSGGHEAGDEFLREISLLLRKCVRNSDILARIGNDEFGILLKDCPIEKGEQIAKAIVDEVTKHNFRWNDVQFHLNVAIGLTVAREKSDFMQMLSEAEAACAVAKTKVRNRIHMYSIDDDLISNQTNQLKWVREIKNALEHDRFCLYVQKIVPLAAIDDKNQYNEVLVRMLDKDDKIIPPLHFIPSAERFGLMNEVDRWVVKTTFKTIKERYLDHGLDHGKIAINLSGQSLSDADTLPFIEQMFKSYGVDPAKFCFEITETVAIENIQHAKRLIDGLKKYGTEFSLDDFGSGMSSFGYLKHLNVDYLKIDGIFVKDMINNPTDLKLVHAIHQLGKVMGIKTVAEFVENGTIMEKLRELGVDFAQGYAIDKPQPI